MRVCVSLLQLILIDPYSLHAHTHTQNTIHCSLFIYKVSTLQYKRSLFLIYPHVHLHTHTHK